MPPERRPVMLLKERKDNMKRSQKLLVGLMLIPLLTAGCTFNAGVQDGLESGVSAALSALIEAPIEYMLDQLFAGS